MIYILLATYNGEKYFSEQIESVLSQTYQDWKLWIHDDGSKDNTVQIIRNYTNQYPEKIVFWRMVLNVEEQKKIFLIY